MAGGLREVLALYLDAPGPSVRAARPATRAPRQTRPAGARQQDSRAVLAIPTRNSDLVEPALLAILAEALTAAGLRVALRSDAAYQPPFVSVGVTPVRPCGIDVDLWLAPFAAERLDDPAAPLPPLDRVLLWVTGHPAGLQCTSLLLDQLARRRPGARAEVVFLGVRNVAEAATCFQRLALPKDRDIALRHLAALPSGPWLARILVGGTPGDAPSEFRTIAQRLARS